MSWTDENVELLRQLWRDGRSCSQISAVLGQGLTRNAVIGKVHRLGLAGRVMGSNPLTPRRVNTVIPPKTRRARVRVVAHGAYHGLAVIAPKPEPEAIVAIPMSLRVTIVELKEAMCRWPLGDPSSAEFRYCGSPAPGVAPYCTHHGKLAYQPDSGLRKRGREIAA